MLNAMFANYHWLQWEQWEASRYQSWSRHERYPDEHEPGYRDDSGHDDGNQDTGEWSYRDRDDDRWDPRERSRSPRRQH